MLTESKGSIFKIIIFVFAAIFANLSVDTGYRGHYTPPTDSNEIESLIELVLEVGLDMYQAVPENRMPERDDSITKANIFDWYCENIGLSQALAIPVSGTSPGAVYIDHNIREHIIEIIPPPPKG